VSGGYTLSPRAREDLHEIAEFLAAQAVDRALHFYDAAWNTFDRLAQSPQIGRTCEYVEPELIGTRWWPITGFRKYLVFYQVVSGQVYILRLMHGARDSPARLQSP
jgi:toxin ParE1/3/4